MKRITAWFDRHPKTRIALQLGMVGVSCLCFIMTGLVYRGIVVVGSNGMPSLLFAVCGLIMFGFAWTLKRRTSVDISMYPGLNQIAFVLELLGSIGALGTALFLLVAVPVIIAFKFG